MFETRNKSDYVCDNKIWRIANCAEKAERSLCTANDSSLVEACEKVGEFDIDYVCSGSKWHAVTNPFEYTLADWKRKRDAYNAAAVKAKVNSDSMITDPRDKNVYRTVVINGKRVFAENLRYVDSKQKVNLKDNMWCYNDEAKNCEIGGTYYTWTAAANLDSKWQSASASSLISEQHQGICPDGWHVPNNAEWRALFSGVGSAAQQMVGFNRWTAATNASGFSALPVGSYYNGKVHVDSHTYLWSVSEYNDDYACQWNLDPSSGYFDDSVYFKYYGFVVRCFQDTP